MIEIFISYSQSSKDETLLKELRNHLSLLEMEGLVHICDDHIPSGLVRTQVVNQRLNSAQIILLLISPDYISSHDCYTLLERAMERYNADAIPVFAVLLRPVLWNDTRFRGLGILPTNRKPIVKWRTRDDGFLNVAMEIHGLIEADYISSRNSIATNDLPDNAAPVVVDSLPSPSIPVSPDHHISSETEVFLTPSSVDEPMLPLSSVVSISKEELIARGNVAYIAGQYGQALTFYERALQVDPRDATLHYYKGHALLQLMRLQHAIKAYEEALHLAPDDIVVLRSKRRATTRLRVRIGAFAAIFLLILLIISGILVGIQNYSHNLHLASSQATATAQARSGSATPASNPTSTGTPSPLTSYPPANAKLDFSDPLNRTAAGWPTASGCQFASGAYLVSSTKASNSCFYQKAYTDLVYEIQMKFMKTASQGDSCGGIVFRYGNPTPAVAGMFIDYSFVICASGACQVTLEGTTIPLGRDLYSSDGCKGLNKTPGHTNTIAVVAQGSSFTIFINKVQLAQLNDSSASTGTIGVTAASGSGEVEVAFTNAKVWTL